MDAYYTIRKLYGMENITTEEVMKKLDMFQARFEKWTNLDGDIWREFNLTLACSLPSNIFRKIFLYMR